MITDRPWDYSIILVSYPLKFILIKENITNTTN